MSLLAKKFRQASFRGIPFFIDTVETETGRRTADFEYPGRDTPHSQDLGRKARVFTFDAYVLGETYEAARDNLIRACEIAGAGSLIHPYLGAKRVVCKSCRVREKKGELGFAQFSLTFREAGESLFPVAAEDSLSSMESAVAAVENSAAENFISIFDSLGTVPSFVVDSVEAKVQDACDLMSTVAKAVRSRNQSIADFSYQVRNIRADVTRLVQTPSDLVSEFQDALRQVGRSFGANKSEVRLAYKTMGDFGSDFIPISETTSNRTLQSQAESGLSYMVRRSSVANGALAAAEEEFESLDDAIAAKEDLTEEIDALIEAATGVHDKDDNVLDALQALRKQVLKSVPGQSTSLPQLIDYTPDNTTNSLVLSYRLYESVDNADDIVSRNHIINPAFIPGGRALKVLRGTA